MKIENIEGKVVEDSRKEETIQVLVETELGKFAVSSPSGKSKGEKEIKSYNDSIEEDIEELAKLSEEIKDIEFRGFKDLEKVEDIVISEKIKNKSKNAIGRIGANTLFALEASILKAIASEQDKKVWEVVNKNAKKFPSPVGNCIGGGLHSKMLDGKKPDFQEFLFIPETDNFSDSVLLMKRAHKRCGEELEARNARGKRNDENAWMTSLSNEKTLGIVSKIRKELEEESGDEIKIGIDIAASTFYSGVYNYKNPEERRNKEEQIKYISTLVDKYNIDYIEDPMDEEDFEGFSQLKSAVREEKPTCLVVGDDLTVSQLKRTKKAVIEKSINAIILKPNQVGSLIELAKVASLASKKGIKTIMSHRSGETIEPVLADLAFGFQVDYMKSGVIGKEREVKLNRMIKIEKEFKE